MTLLKLTHLHLSAWFYEVISRWQIFKLISSTYPLVFGCWELSHVIFLMWFFSNWERKNCLQSWAYLQSDNYFHSKRQPRTILSENDCHFLNFLIFARSSFFLSMRKITWLNCQPKTRPHVEDLCYFHKFKLMFPLLLNIDWKYQLKLQKDDFQSFLWKNIDNRSVGLQSHRRFNALFYTTASSLHCTTGTKIVTWVLKLHIVLKRQPVKHR